MNNNITIVTGLWNMGRDEIPTAFKRSYTHYMDKFAELLKTPNNMIIFAAEADHDFIWEHRSPENTYIRTTELEAFKTYFPFFNQVQDIRVQSEWYLRASWLTESPQATLEYYNPVVMSKMFMLNDASLYDPFDSTHFYWIDAGITNTVHQGYFNHDMVFDNLEQCSDILGQFIMLSYPYEEGDEIHGFPRSEMEKWCGREVKYVCRGGFFGGNKKQIRTLNETYYQLLGDTLNTGLMGTEETIFAIIAHKYPDLVSRFEIGGEGLVWPFFEQLKDPGDFVRPITQLLEDQSEYKTSLYVLGFNSPTQFDVLCKSILAADDELFTQTRKILINNTVDESLFEEYDTLCDLYGFEEIHKDNLGVCGGRQFTAEHFKESDSDYCMFFEDDMTLNPPTTAGETCRIGFSKFIPNLYQTVLGIMMKEKFDFLKFSFSEFYLDNNMQVAWYNVPQVVREEVWPDYNKLPEQGFDMNSPRTLITAVESCKGVPYAHGQIYYGNWPQIVSKEGSQKMFLDTTWARPYEQTWMSHIFQLTLKDEIKAGILLASPVTHDRFEFYEGNLRKES